MTKARRQFAAFDIDGTLFRSGLYREVFFELSRMGSIPDSIVQESTEKHRQWRCRTHGNAFEEFELALVNNLDSIVHQLKISDYEEAVKRVIDKKADNVYVYTRNLLRQLKDEGYFMLAISGSQEEIVEPFAKRYGFDKWVGQKWERGDEFFTGNITKMHTGKDKVILGIIDEYNLTLEGSYAVGDSNGDRGMLEIVDYPIAFNPTQELYEKAIENGWKIVVERKNIAYEMTGEKGGPYILEKANLF